MREHEIKSKFDNAITERLNDSAWDLKIAARVNGRRKDARRKLIISTAVSFAGIAFVLLTFFNTDKSDLYDFNKLISLQTNGTYSKVFNENYTNIFSVDAADDVLYDDIDGLIHNALSMRE